MLINKLLQINKTCTQMKANSVKKYNWIKNNWKDTPVIGKYHNKTEILFPLLNWP